MDDVAVLEQDVVLLDEHTESADAAELLDELLIEEISIDGMCGVY